MLRVRPCSSPASAIASMAAARPAGGVARQPLNIWSRCRNRALHIGDRAMRHLRYRVGGGGIKHQQHRSRWTFRLAIDDMPQGGF